MRIGVIGFCTAPGTAFAVKQIMSNADVQGFEAVIIQRENRVEEVLRHLAGCDVVLSHHIPPEYGRLSTNSMKEIVAGKFLLIPHIAFSGFHPDITYLWGADKKEIHTRFGPYNSKIVAASVALGLAEPVALGLFHQEVFQALGYFEEYAKAKAFALRQYSIMGKSIAELFSRWERRSVFMHNVNHPKSHVLFDIASQALKDGNIIDTAPPLEIVQLDHLTRDMIWPVYPPIASALNLSAGNYLFKSYGFAHGGTGEVPLLNLKEFVECSYADYRKSGALNQDTPGLEKAKEALKRFV